MPTRLEALVAELTTTDPHEAPQPTPDLNLAKTTDDLRPWMRGPFELIRHADGHFKDNGDAAVDEISPGKNTVLCHPTASFTSVAERRTSLCCASSFHHVGLV